MNEKRELEWQHPQPYIIKVTVGEEDTDLLGHTNNVVYLKWLEKAAWDHSAALGWDWPQYRELGKAFVAYRHELDYLGASFPGERLAVGTWIAENDGKLGMWRAYQIIREDDGKTLLNGKTHWVCVDLESGRPRRMPEELKNGFAVTPG